VLLAASEVVGFAKTGGLADVAGTLPAALARRGHDCAVIMPLYRCVRTGPHALEALGIPLHIPIGGRLVMGSLWRAVLPESNVPVYLVEQADYYERDDPATGRGLYQCTEAGTERDYSDNCERFLFFDRAVLESVRLLDFWPDVLHLNDWQTGLIPVLLREVYFKHADSDRYRAIRTLLTIHNIAYQGNFWHWDMKLTGLDWKLFNSRQLEFHGHLNFLKAGLVYSDMLNTVSPTYAREIQTFVYGGGLQGVLAERRGQLFGIVNGVDYRVWDPRHDPYLPARYAPETIHSGKPLCKRVLQERSGLAVQADAPLLGVVARLVEQKGVELIVSAASSFLSQGAQLVVLGKGEPRYHKLLTDLRTRFPRQVGLTFGFDEAQAHLIEAGCDLFLMPSLYEPSGLNQLYSLRYGTLPVVRATGGLADTVVDSNPTTVANGTATGFSFVPFTVESLLDAITRALTLYRNRPDPWDRIVRTAMLQDWSWDRSAASYEELYRRMVG